MLKSKRNAYQEFSCIIRSFHWFGMSSIVEKHKSANQYILFYLIFCAILLSAIFINNILQRQCEYFLIRSIIFATLFFTHFIILSQMFYYRHQQLCLLSKITEIDNILSNKLQITIYYSTERMIVYRKFGILCSILMMIQIGFVYNASRSTEIVLFWLHCWYSTLVIQVACLQIVFYVDLLTRRSHKINEKLQELINCKPMQTMQSHMYGNCSVVDHPSECDNFSLTHFYLYNLKRANLLSYNLCYMINRLFGLCLLIITTQYFIVIITNAYWLFQILRNSEPDIRIAIDFICTFAPNVLLLSVICYSCYGCTQTVMPFNQI